MAKPTYRDLRKTLAEKGEAQSTWDTIQEELRVQREAITRILSGKPRPLSIPSRNGWTLLAHPDTYPGREGKWRITRFEGQEPVGHVECENFAGAVNEAHWFGGQLERATDA